MESMVSIKMVDPFFFFFLMRVQIKPAAVTTTWGNLSGAPDKVSSDALTVGENKKNSKEEMRVTKQNKKIIT